MSKLSDFMPEKSKKFMNNLSSGGKDMEKF